MTRPVRGFSLVSAIFLMVVLVVLGGSIVTLSSVQHSTTAMGVQGLRAHYAAHAGLEWAISRIGGAGCAGAANDFTLGQFDVSVNCSVMASHDLNGTATPYYVVTSTASAGNYGGIDYVSRQLQAKVLNPP